jgi:hypothetical protein
LIIDRLESERIHLPVTFPAVFLPDDLRPLPTLPRDGSLVAGEGEFYEDFVRAGDVRRVLLGEGGGLPVEGLSAEDFGSFAGRSDVPCPSISRRSAPPAAPLDVPDFAFETPLVHPAFEVLPPVRRAAPPRPRVVADCEATFGRTKKLSDRWWVIGMGLAAAAVLLSGTAVDFISREAVRRSRPAVEPVSQVLPRPVPVEVGSAVEARPEAIAATLRPGEEP